MVPGSPLLARPCKGLRLWRPLGGWGQPSFYPSVPFPIPTRMSCRSGSWLLGGTLGVLRREGPHGSVPQPSSHVASGPPGAPSAIAGPSRERSQGRAGILGRVADPSPWACLHENAPREPLWPGLGRAVGLGLSLSRPTAGLPENLAPFLALPQGAFPEAGSRLGDGVGAHSSSQSLLHPSEHCWAGLGRTPLCACRLKFSDSISLA